MAERTTNLSEIPPVKLSKLLRMANGASQVNPLNQDPDLSFEYIMASLFPRVLNNIQDAMTYQYIEGYKAGKAEALAETEQK